jgi:mannose-1-phosphate guanylyltransferase
MTTPTASPAPRAVALILAGGAGTRFWPASRVARPKQLLPLSGPDPLIVQTARRIAPLTGGEAGMLVATGRHLAAPTAAMLPGLPASGLLIEPAARNTAPCIGWAAHHVARTDPDAVVIVLPSDHHIGDEPRFREVAAKAIATAASGVITTVGITPTHAETGYGYIELGDERGAGVRRVLRFVEKPDKARAEEFFTSGRYLWNAGMFFFRAKDMVAAVRAHLPALADGLDAIDRAAREGNEDEAVARIFPTLPSISIDHGVMEKVAELAVVPGDFGWNDVGSWQSAWDLAKKDDAGNAAPEGTVLAFAKDNLVVDLRTKPASGDRVIALLGVEGLVLVETDDALLVVPRERAQDVREVVERLKQGGRGSLV